MRLVRIGMVSRQKGTPQGRENLARVGQDGEQGDWAKVPKEQSMSKKNAIKTQKFKSSHRFYTL